MQRLKSLSSRRQRSSAKCTAESSRYKRFLIGLFYKLVRDWLKLGFGHVTINSDAQSCSFHVAKMSSRLRRQTTMWTIVWTLRWIFIETRAAFWKHRKAYYDVQRWCWAFGTWGKETKGKILVELLRNRNIYVSYYFLSVSIHVALYTVFTQFKF